MKIDNSAFFNISYGLYVITSFDGERHNGCIVNTVVQVTNSPVKISVAINKGNYTHDTVKRTGRMNVNALTVDAPFKVFEVFGFASGKDTDKFKDCTPSFSENGLVVLPKYINSFISLEVESYIDLGTHGMFICTVTEAKTVSDRETMTYTMYHKHVKPKPAAEKSSDETKKKGYVCTVCGYVHEGDELPDDFVCPLCKHGAEVFVPIES
jgi:flavin reductase (DIM6/NTAB) family NADH-FMN oxidoreductase RutF